MAVSLRNLCRNKGHAFINLDGLAVGLTRFNLFLLFVRNELSYDQCHADAGHIYRTLPQQKPCKVFLGREYLAVSPALRAGTLARENSDVQSPRSKSSRT